MSLKEMGVECGNKVTNGSKRVLVRCLLSPNSELQQGV